MIVTIPTKVVGDGTEINEPFACLSTVRTLVHCGHGRCRSCGQCVGFYSYRGSVKRGESRRVCAVRRYSLQRHDPCRSSLQHRDLRNGEGNPGKFRDPLNGRPLQRPINKLCNHTDKMVEIPRVVRLAGCGSCGYSVCASALGSGVGILVFGVKPHFRGVANPRLNFRGVFTPNSHVRQL